MALDIEKEVVQIAGMIRPGVTLFPETVTMAIEAVEEVDFKYGPHSDNPLEHHNAPHTIGAMRRGVRVANIFFPYIQPVHRPKFFDLTIYGEATHDLEQLLKPGENEKASTEDAIDRIEAVDGALNNEKFKHRLSLGHLATVAEIQEDGSIVQVNLLSGSRDPIKIVMAYGDTGGIGMEGDKAMWDDGTNVYYESTARAGNEPTSRGLYRFLGRETAFVRSQTNEEQVKAVVSRYFPDHEKAIYEELQKRFQGNVKHAFMLAKMLDKHPELEHSIDRIVSVADRSRVGRLIGELVRRKASRGD